MAPLWNHCDNRDGKKHYGNPTIKLLLTKMFLLILLSCLLWMNCYYECYNNNNNHNHNTIWVQSYMISSSSSASSSSSSFLGRRNNISYNNNNHHHYHRSGELSRMGLRMGMEIKIRIVGRNKSGGESQKWLEEAYDMYDTRLRSSNVGVDTIWHKNDDDLIKGVEGDADKGHSIVLLDPIGKTCTSEQFSNNMYRWLEDGGSRLVFVIGGAEGLPPSLKYPSNNPNNNKKKSNKKQQKSDNNKLQQQQQPNLLSLSALTFTHQFARTLLMEQIYRASEIRKGSGYHK
jgi:23S rRNA (pseudouridine1915-N3)-methyltransferase